MDPWTISDRCLLGEAASYTVMLHDLVKCVFLRNVRPERLRRIFKLGENVDLYRGASLGWVPSVVMGLPAASTDWCQCRHVQCPDCLHSPINQGKYPSWAPAHASPFEPQPHAVDSLCPLCSQQMTFTGRPCSDSRSCPWVWVAVFSDEGSGKHGQVGMLPPPGCALSAVLRRKRARLNNTGMVLTLPVPSPWR